MMSIICRNMSNVTTSKKDSLKSGTLVHSFSSSKKRHIGSTTTSSNRRGATNKSSTTTKKKIVSQTSVCVHPNVMIANTIREVLLGSEPGTKHYIRMLNAPRPGSAEFLEHLVGGVTIPGDAMRSGGGVGNAMPVYESHHVVLAVALEHAHRRNLALSNLFHAVGWATGMSDKFQHVDADRLRVIMETAVKKYSPSSKRALSAPDQDVLDWLKFAKHLADAERDILDAVTLTDLNGRISRHLLGASSTDPDEKDEKKERPRPRPRPLSAPMTVHEQAGGGSLFETVQGVCTMVGSAVGSLMPFLSKVPTDLKTAFTAKQHEHRMGAWKRVGIQCALSALKFVCIVTTPAHMGVPCIALTIFSDEALRYIIRERTSNADARRRAGEDVSEAQDEAVVGMTRLEQMQYMWYRVNQNRVMNPSTHDKRLLGDEKDTAAVFGALRGASSKLVWTEHERLYAQFINMRFAIFYFGMFEKLEIVSRVSERPDLSGWGLLRDVLYGRLNQPDAMMLAITTSRYGCEANSVDNHEQLANLSALTFIIRKWAAEETEQGHNERWASMKDYDEICTQALALAKGTLSTNDMKRGVASMRDFEQELERGLMEIVRRRREFRAGGVQPK